MKKQDLDNIHKLKDSEFTNLLHSISFKSKKNKDKESDKLKEKVLKKDNSFKKNLALATNYIYLLISPLILLLSIYYILVKYVFNRQINTLLIFLIFLGLFTGYWSIFKQIRGRDKWKR